MAKRSVELRNWNMWVVNRCATLVVEIPEGVDEAEAEYAITTYVGQNLDEGGGMHDLFGHERKVGDPEAGDTVIDAFKEAPPDAQPDLRLRFVEDDAGRVEAEAVREDQRPKRRTEQPRTWIDSRTKYEPLVEQLSDDDLCDLVAVIHRRLCIPNWFAREHLERMTGQEVSEDDWKEFLDWLDDTQVPDRLSAQFLDWWDDYQDAAQDEEEEDRAKD